MIRLYSIVGASVLWLAALIALVTMAGQSGATSLRPPPEFAPASFVIGGVSLPATSETTIRHARDPFHYAPTAWAGSVAVMETAPSANSENLLDLNATLKGVLVRSGKPVAFIEYQGKRKALRAGDELGESAVVETVEADRVRLKSPSGKTRWLYLVN